MKQEENIKNKYYKLIDTITDSNQELLSKFSECIKNPKEYYKNNYSIFEERGIEYEIDDEEIVFWAMLDLLLKNDYCCELDYKEYVEEFIESLKTLKNALPFKEDKLDYNDDIFIWCNTINKEWKYKDMCISTIDIDSDSYILFVCNTGKLKQLSSLGNQIDTNIYKVQYTEQELQKEKEREDEYYSKHLKNRIIEMSFEKNKKRNQILIGISTVLCLIIPCMIPVILGISNEILSHILAFSLVILFFTIFIFILKAIDKIKILLFYKIPDGEKYFNFINVKNDKVLEELYKQNAIIFTDKINDYTLRFIYNWLNNNKFLKTKKIDVYLVKGKTLYEKFSCNLYENTQTLLCISFNNLNINEKNKDLILNPNRYLYADLLGEKNNKSFSTCL